MYQFEVTILGSAAALPARGRNPSAQVLNANGVLYLIDCAEGTQMRLRLLGISIQKIGHIFISHLHGDHYFGLVGLISSMHLLGREKELRVFGPVGLKKIVDLQLELSGTFLKYPLNIIEMKEGSGALMDDKALIVSHFPLKHRIECHGFLFREKERPRNIKKEYIEKYNLSIQEIIALKSGQNVILENGTKVDHADATGPPQDPRTYAYCSDTAYNSEVVGTITGCDLLYHEATFADDMKGQAKKTFHSTARQAAGIAKAAGVGKLLIGHFSSRYKDLKILLMQAQEEFPNTELAEEGSVFKIG